jgi:endonuclease/exonuclease/phosphatase family metal-dependent hydrolase
MNSVNFLRWAVLATVLLLTACASTPNYRQPDAPLFAGHYAETAPIFGGELKVVTWNIKFSRQIEAAIADLSGAAELQDADILLLQEMDETGVEAIAQALKYNYIYFPASLHPETQKNFGEAILSKWPIDHPAKVLLPYKNPKNGQQRIAARAEVEVGKNSVRVYSVHTETFWLGPEERRVQVETLAQDIGDEAPYVIIGGDFNSFTPASIATLDEALGAAGLARVSAGAGPTLYATGLEFSLDHIFTRAMPVLATGAFSAATASDHLPLWVQLQFAPLNPAGP